MKAEKVEKVEVQKVDSHGVDLERMDAALASYAATLAEIARGDDAAAALVARLTAVDAEIAALRLVACEIPDYATMTIEEVRSASEKVQVAQHQISGLNSLRTELTRQLESLNNGRDLSNHLSKTDSRRHCFRVLYEGLLSTFDKESLNQVLTAGIACGLSEQAVMRELNPIYDIRHIESFIKQFGMPL